MEGRNRNIIASNADAREEILKCAMYSYCGRIIYRKWDKKERRFVRRSHVVVPIDCGVTSRGNEVLFAEDVQENMQVKQFIIRQILDFENLKEKRKTAFPIKLDNIKRMLGIRKVTEEESGMAAGANRVRNLVAGELARIAQEIYEFSGCEGHLYSDRKMRNPNSYEVVGTIAEERVANRIVAALTESQKQMTEHFTKQRAEGLSFGDYFQWDSNGRCYIPLSSGGVVQDLSKMNDDDSKEIYEILKKEGYVCPDYATGYCYKESDTDFSAKNAPKVLTILRKALKNDKATFERLSKSFNERGSGALKRRGTLRLLMCITHNPEDIAGMSTDRDWVSCMRLPSSPEEVSKDNLMTFANKSKKVFNVFADYYGLFGRQKKSIDEIANESGFDVPTIKSLIRQINYKITEGGQYYTTALKQVKYGGMVAYLIREDDRNIDKPLARLAIKRFENGDGGFSFEPESIVYGDNAIAESCDFEKALKRELDKSNKTTEKGGSQYHRSDGHSWSDASTFTKGNGVTVDELCSMDWSKVYDVIRKQKPRLTEKDLDRMIDAHKFAPPKGLFVLFAKFCGELSDEFVERHADLIDIDLYNYENGIDIIPMEHYDGDDAPRSKDEMNEQIRQSLERTRYGDDYGSVHDSKPLFYGMLPPLVDMLDRDDLPDEVRNTCANLVISALKDYYDSIDEQEFKDKFRNFAMFEEAFFDGTLDDNEQWAVNDSISDSLSYDGQIEYEIKVNVVDVLGYDEADSIYVLHGEFAYYRSDTDNGKVVAYSNETVINTEDAGWKKKLDGFTEDLFDQIPDFY